MREIAQTKYEMYIAPNLAEIEKRIADGETEGSIARSYGISLSTWTDYKGKYPDFLDAIKRGNVGLDDAVEINFNRYNATCRIYCTPLCFQIVKAVI